MLWREDGSPLYDDNRAGTFTRQLAIVQSSVVDPGRSCIAAKTALCYVYPVILTPETRGSLPKRSFCKKLNADVASQ
jgi:hypothetical protein